jgi:outer membrane protein assembly factor BamB
LRYSILFGLVVVASGSLVGSNAWGSDIDGSDIDKEWPQWRGPNGTGAAEEANPPTSWSESENIRWKAAVPGIGGSTAIVLGDRVFVSAAVKTDRVAESEGSSEEDSNEQAQRRSERPDQRAEENQRPGQRGGFGRGGGRRGRGGFGGGSQPTNYYDFLMLAFDRATGEERWRTTVAEVVPHEAGHNTNTFASASPLTDGERLYVSFGSRGLYCLSLDGDVIWNVDLGQMQTRNAFGEGSSPALHKGTLVVPWDHEGDSFIVALDATNGEEKWRMPRDERTTWATPLITDYDGRSQVIANGSNRVRSYDLETGELIWECGGQVGNPIPSPVRYEDNAIVMTGFRGFAIYSIPLSAKGDITGTDTITWSVEDAAPYVSSPVLYKGQLYFLKSNDGIVVSRDAHTGERVIDQTRVPGISSVYASRWPLVTTFTSLAVTERRPWSGMARNSKLLLPTNSTMKSMDRRPLSAIRFSCVANHTCIALLNKGLGERRIQVGVVELHDQAR